MPVSPETGSRFAAPVADLLARHELELLESAAQALRGDQTVAGWEATSLQRIRMWRAQAEAAVPGAMTELRKALRVALLGAQREGIATALVDLPGEPAAVPQGMRGVLLSERRLGAQLATALQSAPRLLEATLREAVRAGVDEVRAGKLPRRAASQRVLDKLVAQGVTGFRDSAGRNWSLSSYTEMAVRTETQARALEAGDVAIRAVGITQVIVSDSPRECPLCRPFEGKVLEMDGDGVDGPETLTSARAKGFQHPNCTHSYSAYQPGITKLEPAKANPDGYEAKQRQRALERQVRSAKRSEALALDPAAKAQARARVRDRQAQLRQHVKDEGLKRQPGRESVTRAV